MPDIILIVEDEPHMGTILQDYFAAHGVESDLASDGDTALDAFARRDYDAVLLDVMIPGLDGYGVCRAIRRESSLPILFLTALGGEEQALYGYSLGADDYVTKPFHPLELVARVKTQLRRYRRYNREDIARQQKDAKPQEVQEYDIRGLWISQETHECTLNGQEIALTPIEFRILWYLCCHQGKVVPSEELYEQVWGEKYLDSNNTVMAHIARLREKLSEPARKPNYIKTVWGVGYKIEP